MLKLCVVCGATLPKGRSKYCSWDCRNAMMSARYSSTNFPKSCNTNTTGTISELRVAIDLMGKGFEVFRALSPSCPCDLAVLKGEALLRIEVRTTFKSPTGKIYRSGVSTDYGDYNRKNDHYAWVLPYSITYEPPLPPMPKTRLRRTTTDKKGVKGKDV